MITQQNKEEKWAIIPNYPNYEASNIGNVRRLLNGRLLTLRTDEAGYRRVMLYTDKKKYNKRVARLVWSAFNEYECEMFIDHIDKNIQNNNLDNLRCVNASQNSLNRNDFSKDNRYKLNNDIKRDIIKRYRNGDINTYQINKIYGVKSNYFSMVAKRKTWDKLLNDGERV